MRCHWRLFVTITPLLQSMESTCHRQVCIVVLVHLVLSMLAALVICVGYMYVLWCLERTWCCQCLLHLVLSVLAVPGAVSACCTWCCQCLLHLVLSVLAALGICVGYMWCLERIYVLVICIVVWHAPGARRELPL